MKPTQTGIATAVALVVVVFFFMFNGMSFFQTGIPTDQTAATAEASATAEAASTTQSTQTTTTMQPLTQLMIKDEVVGTGATAATGDIVTVNYVGSLTNGTVFDASANHGTAGFTFTLGAGQVIKGWDEGVVGMKVGGKRMLAIPAALAYGSQAVGNVIPANSDLIFEVELVKVQKPAR